MTRKRCMITHLRLVADVDIKPDDVLIGLSMGGMVAQEVAAAYPVSKVILVSSLRSGETLQPLFYCSTKI
jgi:pimeloyl-ACP methyl ester carboxylesterase